ncbi:hypothetical protein ECPA49_5302, partial [Escherichia coli PA49]
MVDALASG